MSFGSKRWFPYTTDDGTVYALNLDESNTELLNTGAGAMTPPAGAVTLPKTFLRRKVKLLAANQSTKTVVMLTRALYDGVHLGDTLAAPAVGEENPAGTAFIVIQRIPEIVRNAPRAIDTGKLDGDQP